MESHVPSATHLVATALTMFVPVTPILFSAVTAAIIQVSIGMPTSSTSRHHHLSLLMPAHTVLQLHKNASRNHSQPRTNTLSLSHRQTLLRLQQSDRHFQAMFMTSQRTTRSQRPTTRSSRRLTHSHPNRTGLQRELNHNRIR